LGGGCFFFLRFRVFFLLRLSSARTQKSQVLDLFHVLLAFLKPSAASPWPKRLLPTFPHFLRLIRDLMFFVIVSSKDHRRVCYFHFLSPVLGGRVRLNREWAGHLAGSGPLVFTPFVLCVISYNLGTPFGMGFFFLLSPSCPLAMRSLCCHYRCPQPHSPLKVPSFLFKVPSPPRPTFVFFPALTVPPWRDVVFFLPPFFCLLQFGNPRPLLSVAGETLPPL